MTYYFPQTKEEQKELFEIFQDITSFIDIFHEKKARLFAYRSTLKLRKKYIKGSYSDMYLWRIFPNKKRKTIQEFNESLKKNNVMVTSLNVFQSWTKDREKAIKYWEFENHYVDDPSATPLSVFVGAKISGGDIMLDVFSDYYPYLVQCIQKFPDMEDKLTILTRRLSGHVPNENEVFVRLKGKQIAVDSIYFVNEVLEADFV